jgi:hypothetical protein
MSGKNAYTKTIHALSAPGEVIVSLSFRIHGVWRASCLNTAFWLGLFAVALPLEATSWSAL